MRRISRVTLALTLAAAVAGAAPAVVAAPADGDPDRPVLSRLFERLLGPFHALAGDRARGMADAPPPAVPAEGEQDGGPGHDPDAVTAPGGSQRDPIGLGGSGGTPPPSAPAEGEQDGGPERDPNG